VFRSMSEERQFATAVSELYELIIDTGWSGIPAFVASRLGGASAVLNITCGSGPPLGSIHGLPTVSHTQFASCFRLVDPWAVSGRGQCPPFTVMRGWDLAGRLATLSVGSWADATLGWDSGRAIGGHLPFESGECSVAVLRADGARPFDDIDLAWLKDLLPHMQGALRLGGSLRTRRGKDAQAALEAIALGVIVCNSDALVRYMNSAAERLVRSSAGFSLHAAPARLSAIDYPQRTRLRDLIARAASGDETGAIGFVEPNCEQTLLLVTPAPKQFASKDGSVLVLARSTARANPPSETTLRDLFGLTSAEAALAAGLWNGDTFADLARHRGVADSTIRTQLASTFRKTGVSGQQGLVRLMNLVPPIISNSRPRVSVGR